MCTISCFFIIYKQVCFQIISLHFSINNLWQNVGSVHEYPFQNLFCVSVINCSDYPCSFLLRILEYILLQVLRILIGL